jgi:hypothetical protein
MKKIIAAVSAVSMCLVLGGCAPSVESVYKTAYENATGSKSMTASVSVDMSIEASGSTMDMPMTADIQLVNPDDDDKMEGHINIGMELLGTSTEAEMWIKDKKMYISSNGSNTETDLDTSELMESYYMPVTIDSFESCTMEKDGSDNKITCKMKQDSVDKLFSSISSSAENSTGYDLSGLTASIGDMVYTVDSSNNLKSSSFTLTASGTVASTDVTYTYDVKTDYSSWNSTKIDFPDLSSWE